MPMTDAGSIPRTVLAELWFNRNFRWLFVTSSISFVGNQFSIVAIPWLALRLTDSPTVLATTMAFMAIPKVAFILVGGAMADRYSPRSILTVTHCANAVVLAALAITTLSGLLQTHILLVLALLSGTAAAFAIPAASSLLPRIVPLDSLAHANSASMMSNHIAMVIGPIAAGSLIAWVSSATRSITFLPFAEAAGISTALAVDTVTFLIAAWLVRFIRVPQPTQQPSRSVFMSVGKGLQWFWNDRPLRILVLYWGAMLLLAVGSWQIGIPVLADRQLRSGAPGLGILITATSLGLILGVGIASFRPNRRIARLGTTILAADILVGASLIALSHTRSMVLAALLCTLMGLCRGYVQIGVITWIQQRIPLDMLGRAMSVITLVLVGTTPVSAAITGALLTQLTIASVLTAYGSLIVLVALLCLSNGTLRSIGTRILSSNAAELESRSRQLG
jgi:MFS family permease